MTALIVVDIQNDFLPGGALPVPRGEEVIPKANKLMEQVDVVVATQDWHPRGHLSFAANHPGKTEYEVITLDGLPQTLWPVHCVEETHGAAFAAGLDVSRFAAVFRKGQDPRVDSYSGFWDNGRRHSTGLAEWLRKRGVRDVVICGLATDYCVKATALDAAAEGFRTFVALDACRGVNLHHGDVERAADEMRRGGVTLFQN